MKVWNERFFNLLVLPTVARFPFLLVIIVLAYFFLSAAERKPPQKGHAKKTIATKDAVEEEAPTKPTTTTTTKELYFESQKPPPTSKKRKLKNPKFQWSNQTMVQPKKPAIPKVLEVDPEPATKTTPERLESDNSSSEAEGHKGDAEGIGQSSVKQIIPVSSSNPSYHPTSTHLYHLTITPSYHLTSTKDSTKGFTGEISKPAEEQQEVSPQKTTTQHSQTTDSDRDEEEEHPTIEVQEDVNMQDAEEDIQDKSNDASPDILDQVKDVPDDEEEQDEDRSMFDIPPIDNQNEQ
ncbi:uncharacterized protein LOC127095477 [Lathyrus oleraceus]|uniref:uncharacterized protein LOC127095477 n=1 Tax=Pisum sativum TaxID=3888 RepID=UPI0021D30515|nr:uncharacterized protein LOC127095477 [Pisum sativum]